MQKGSHIAILDLSKAISRKRCKIGGKLVLITNRKSYMSFRLVPKSVILNDLERRNCRYFALFQRIRVPSGRTAFTFAVSSPNDSCIQLRVRRRNPVIAVNC